MEARRLLATITVTGTGDDIALDGIVTLREAITAANTDAPSGDAGAGDAGLDTIAFNIPGTGVHTIKLGSDLPPITEPVTIDGYTQPGSSPNTNGSGLGDNAAPRVQLVPNAARLGSAGLRITGGGSTVRGLVINGFYSGIDLRTGGGNTIAGNYIGTTPDGLALGEPGGLENAILLESSNNKIGTPAPADRNLLAGYEGVHVPTDAVADGVSQCHSGQLHRHRCPRHERRFPHRRRHLDRVGLGRPDRRSGARRGQPDRRHLEGHHDLSRRPAR
jgi:hypothetical protein